MIQYFSTLYAGHILEGQGIGFNGTPAHERAYNNADFAQVFDIVRRVAQ
jgi:hypothetical protein